MYRTARLQDSMPDFSGVSNLGRMLRRHWDLLLLSALLVVANWPLLYGSVNGALIYHPGPVGAGEWWRLVSYPFAHLSWYHLMLDASAFFLLYTGLEEKRRTIKLMILVACGASSLLLGVWLGAAQNLGLAGLSGVDHGLMAVCALEMVQSATRRRPGLTCFLLVLGKSVYELAAGDVVFEALHMDLCGIPVAACHGGGFLGGVLVFWALNAAKSGKGLDAKSP